MNNLEALIVLLLGLVMGSFLNVIIYRLPRKEGFFWGRSRCPSCGHKIKWYHSLPLLSYLILGGKCAYCQRPISFIYPLVELLTAILLLLTYSKFKANLATVFFFGTYILFGIAITFIDLKTKEIPDLLSFPLFGLGLIFSLLSLNPLVETFELSLISGLSGIGLLFLVNEIYYLLMKRDGMGMGDLKFMAGIGSFMSFYSFYYVLFYASLSALVSFTLFLLVKKIKKQDLGISQGLLKVEIPYGPFLFLGSVIYLYFPQRWLL